MAAKTMGRPTDDPKPNRRCYRLSNEDMKKVEYCMKMTGLSESAVIRKGLDALYSELMRNEK